VGVAFGTANVHFFGESETIALQILTFIKNPQIPEISSTNFRYFKPLLLFCVKTVENEKISD
jgi:hypothetical protein